MKFHVLCVLNRPLTTSPGQQLENRAVTGKILEIQSPEQLVGAVAEWLQFIMRDEPCSTQLLSLSHTQIH